MREYTEKIREIAKKLLEKKERWMSSSGTERERVPMMNEPVLIRDPEKAELLHWDSHCGLNLCNYLTETDREDRDCGQRL